MEGVAQREQEMEGSWMGMDAVVRGASSGGWEGCGGVDTVGGVLGRWAVDGSALVEVGAEAGMVLTEAPALALELVGIFDTRGPDVRGAVWTVTPGACDEDTERFASA